MQCVAYFCDLKKKKEKGVKATKALQHLEEFSTSHTSISPCTQLTLWCLQLSDTALINWKMTTSCALQYMFHNLRKLTHTFSICLPSWEKKAAAAAAAAAVPSSDKVVCACFISVTQDGPHAFVPRDD